MPSKSLPVPYHSQEAPDARRYGNDCGAACVSMLIEYYGKGRISIDSLAAETTLAQHDDGLMPQQLVDLLSKHLISSYVRRTVSITDIYSEIDAGRPVLALITYGYIPERQNKPDGTGGHYVLVVGYDSDKDIILLNDPDWWGDLMAHGDHLVVKTDEFVRAFAMTPLPESAVFVNAYMGIVQFINSLLQANPTLAVFATIGNNPMSPEYGFSAAELVNKLASTLPIPDPNPNPIPTPITPPKPATPPRTVPLGPAHLVEDKVYLRDAPNGLVVEMLPINTNMTVLSDDPVLAGHVWIKVNVSTQTGWIAQEFVSAGNVTTTPVPTPTPTPVTPPSPNIPPRSVPIGPAHVAEDQVHLRAAPNGTIWATLPINTNLTVLPDNPVLTDRTWIKVAVVGGVQTGWIAQEFVAAGNFTPTTTPAPVLPPVPTTSLYLIGAHMMGTLSQAEIAQAAKYGIAKSVDNVGALVGLHQADPHAICIYRDFAYHAMPPEDYIAQHGGADSAADQWIGDMLPFFTQMPFAYFESWNERGMSDAYLAFEAARTRKMAAKGLKACIINMYSGATNPSDWTRAKDAVQATIDHGGLIGVHCYAQTVMSANFGSSRWNAQGQWEGDLFPTAFPVEPDGNYGAWTGLRIIRDAHCLIQQGQGAARLVATELGLDDTGNIPAQIYYPKLNGQDVKTNGWKTCIPIWQDRGWLNGTTPEAFYRRQLAWWTSMVGKFDQIVGGTVYTFGTDDPKWSNFDCRTVL